MNEIKSVFLDTSFFIRFFKPGDPCHRNAQTYFRRFRKQGLNIYFSTVGVAEYGVGGNLDHLPYPFLTLLPFNIDDARLTATMAEKALKAQKKGALEIENRLIVSNDTKLMAQAEVAKCDLFVSRDDNGAGLFSFLKSEGLVSYHFLDLNTPPAEYFGELFNED